MNLFYQPLIPQGVHHLDKEESRHCVKVLRKKSGDDITITDGAGKFYLATIQQADDQRCSFTINRTEEETPCGYTIHISIAPTKNTDRIEWFVEKAVELGINRISFITCQHSERVRIKKERIDRVAISAMKQSLKATLPRIDEMVNFSDCLSQTTTSEKFIAYVDQENKHHLFTSASKGKHYHVLIGPEGDFAPEEVEQALNAGYVKVSLGNSRLRTETAGLAACHILNLLNF